MYCYNKDTADVIYYQQLCGTQILPLNLSQILQNTLRDNRTANISANKYDNRQHNNTPAGLSKGIEVFADRNAGISQNRCAKSHKADMLNIAVDNIAAGHAGNRHDAAQGYNPGSSRNIAGQIFSAQHTYKSNHSQNQQAGNRLHDISLRTQNIGEQAHKGNNRQNDNRIFNFHYASSPFLASSGCTPYLIL